MPNGSRATSQTCPQTVLDLIERFELHADTYRRQEYNEAQVRQEFIDPFFKALGWDMDNESGHAEAYKDVIHEDAIKVGGSTKAPDYCFRIGGVRKFFVEAKKPSVSVADDPAPAYQLRRYAWTNKLPLSIVTDFEEFAVYDCRIKPKPDDKPSAARVLYVKFTDYPVKWSEITSIFSKDSILKGSFDKYAESNKRKRGTAEVDDEFLKEIEHWRDELARNLALRNPTLTVRELNYAVGKTIDRIIFLRMCEDRGVETYAQLRILPNGPRIYPRLVEIFRRADERYNSGLFHFDPERDRPDEPDTLTPNLTIDDKVLKDIVKGLYYPECPYEFSVMPPEILGQVYEQFLGKVIRLTKGHKAVVEDKPEVKKAGGVYYTPKYIVDYIVEHTVGELLKGKTPADVGPMLDANPQRTRRKSEANTSAKQPECLRILDPACGSGSFLIGAYQILLDWHLRWYTENDPVNWLKKKTPPIYESASRGWQLTIAEKKRILLNDIFGVDIDPQAVEVTKLSLLLKVLEGESAETIGQTLRMFHERALPDLGDNIKCGNSLIAPDFYDNQQLAMFDEEERYRINVFDWDAEFSDIKRNGGFDAVIGNPPYVFTRNQGIDEHQKGYFYQEFEHQSTQLNTFGLFVERGYSLLRDRGILGYITPNNLLTIDSFAPLRRFILEKTGESTFINIRDRVFVAANVDTALVTFRRQNPTRLTIGEMFGNGRTLTETTDVCELQAPSYVVRISLLRDAPSRQVIQKITERSAPLCKYATVSTGLKAYQTGKGIPPQTNRQKEGRVFHSAKRENKTYGRYLDGMDVRRYAIYWGGQYLSYGDWLAEPRKSVPYDGERILVRQIPSRPPYLIHAAYTHERFYNDINSMVVFNPVGGESLKYLLGLLNCKLLSFWFLKTFDKLQRRVFPQFKVKELAEFPIFSIDTTARLERARHDGIEQSVQRALERHEQLTATKTPSDQTAIQRQIDATDRKIDQLVYELYGLTDDEIRIVEEATKRE